MDNNTFDGMTHGNPKTIEELKKWYKERKLPPYKVTRFFIGINYTKPKAFGIYQDGYNFIVYKNKADGQRAIRYCGPDEAFAVNELYQKLKEEILRQKQFNRDRKQSLSKQDIGDAIKGFLVLIAVFILIVAVVKGFVALKNFLESLYAGLIATIIVSLVASFVATFVLLFIILGYKGHVKLFRLYSKWLDQETPSSHLLINYAICFVVFVLVLIQPIHSYYGVKYYSYDDKLYAYSHFKWFEYTDYGHDYNLINKSQIPDNLLNNKSEYRIEYEEYEGDDYLRSFEDSGYYKGHYGSSSSDSSYDWDSGDSWDSGGMDWDSDW